MQSKRTEDLAALSTKEMKSAVTEKEKQNEGFHCRRTVRIQDESKAIPRNLLKIKRRRMLIGMGKWKRRGSEKIRGNVRTEVLKPI